MDRLSLLQCPRGLAQVQGDIGRANRFVAAVMALARAGVSLLEEAPASPDVLRDLATVGW